MKPFLSSFPRAKHKLMGLLTACALPLAEPACAQAWQTAVGVGTSSSGSSVVASTATDGSGNVYVVGHFTRTLTLGATTLTSAGGQDVFVAKWSPAVKDFVWAQRAGGFSDDYANAVAVNGASVYVAGFFASVVAGFGSVVLGNRGNTNAYVAKLTDAGNTGNFVWVQQAGGARSEGVSGLAVNGSNVYATGTFSSSSAGFGSLTLSPRGNSDAFVAKITDAGSSASFAWVEQAGGAGSSTLGYALAVSGTNVYVVGTFTSTARFGNVTLPQARDADGFVAKLTDAGSTGAFAWAQPITGAGDQRAYAVATNGTSVFAGGAFTGPTAEFGSVSLINGGVSDRFLAKYTDGGNFSWAQPVGNGRAGESVSGVAVSGNNVYASGSFAGTSTFGNVSLTASGAFDVFVAKLTDAGASGNYAWAQRAGGVAAAFVSGVAIDGANVYVGGSANGPVSFGGLNTGYPASPNTNEAAFLASLTDAGALAVAAPVWAAGVRVFPNPAHEAATVQVRGVTAPARATLFDALGRAVRVQTLRTAGAEAAAELPLAGLAPGLYRLLVQADGQQASRALAVE